MRLTNFVAALVFAPIVARADVVDVPPPAVRFAQQWLDSHRATDPALDGTRLGNGYATMSINQWRTLDFIRSQTVTDPTEFADTLSREFHFPILKADSCFSALRVVPLKEPGQFEKLEPLSHLPDPLDVIVVTLDQLVAKGSHRVWVFQKPWPLNCSTVIAERPDGDRLAFELEYAPTETPSESALMEMGEPVASWTARVRTQLGALYRLDQPPPCVTHKVPSAAVHEAERAVAEPVIDEQRRVFGVSGPATLGTPWINYSLSPVESRLYAESDEVDPTCFDRDPSYSFPVLVDGQRIAIANVMPTRVGCGRTAASEPDSEYRANGFGIFRPGVQADWRPSHLSKLGDVAILDTAFDRWYYIAGRDSAWVAPYYRRSAQPDAAYAPEPIASIAKSLKERIRSQYSK